MYMFFWFKTQLLAPFKKNKQTVQYGDCGARPKNDNSILTRLFYAIAIASVGTRLLQHVSWHRYSSAGQRQLTQPSPLIHTFRRLTLRYWPRTTVPL